VKSVDGASDGTARQAFRCCGVVIDALSFDQAVTQVLGAQSSSAGRSVHLCNAFTLSIAQRDHEFATVLNRGDLNFPDGMSVVWAGRRAGMAAEERVYGPDLMAAVIDRGRSIGLSHYLYGSTPEVLDRLQAALARSYPGVSIVGVESPPFRPLHDDEKRELVDRVRASKPDVMWVGLGTPRQDQFVDEFRDRLPSTLVAIGAAFDFLSGNKPSAPAWMKKRGLEWLFRLLREPRRLWRRYLIGNLVFLYGLARDGAKREEGR
jgi:N-acetylglucosaminyldiphosphoundecaprenol N-acetyl-beta-D-mannosaminyltransferase